MITQTNTPPHKLNMLQFRSITREAAYLNRIPAASRTPRQDARIIELNKIINAYHIGRANAARAYYESDAYAELVAG